MFFSIRLLGRVDFAWNTNVKLEYIIKSISMKIELVGTRWGSQK